MMKVLYSINHENALLAGVSIFSLLQNNTGKDIVFYILVDRVKDSELNKIKEVIEAEGAHINIINVAEIDKNVSPTKQKDASFFYNFGCLFASSLLHEENKILYLDANTIIDGSLLPLWEIQLGNHMIAGVADYLNHRYLENIGLRKNELYFDSAVLLLNLRMMRETRIEEQFSDYLHANSFLAFQEEDVLNSVVTNEQKLTVPAKFNVTVPIFLLKRKQLIRFQKLEKYQVNGYDFNIAKLHPVVVNYRENIFTFKDPWADNSKHPVAKWFNKYKNVSPWKDVSIPKTIRKLPAQLDNLIYMALPKFISLTILGDKYGRRRPLSNRKKILKSRDIKRV